MAKISTKGFTLVELIVVIVVLGILATIATPSLVGYIDKSRSVTVIAECRQCVEAAQSLATARHGSTSALPDDKIQPPSSILDEIAKLAEIPDSGTVHYVVFSDSVVTELLYSNGGIFVLYKNGEYTTVEGVGSSDGSGSASPPKPADTMFATSVFDPVTGEYVDIKVRGNVYEAKNYEVRNKLVYFEGNDKYEEGYYCIASWEYDIPMNAANFERYIQKITNNGANPGAFRKVNTDAPIGYYDPKVETGHSLNKDNNTSIRNGQFYYMNFTWDDNPDPVLALFVGSETDVGWRGDLQGLSYETNKGLWILASNL